jgi:nucleolar protein 16
MTTARQRKKQKSGNSASARSKKAVQKRIKRAPTMHGPAAIRDNWDPKATVRENYKRLGLIGDLSMRDSGGSEKTYSQPSIAKPKAGKSNKPTLISSGTATIERDEEGNVISIQENTTQQVQTAWGPALNSDEEEEEEIEEEEETQPKSAKAIEVISALEEAAQQATPVERFTSTREHDWLYQMINKYGSDVEAMSKDRSINVWQKTPGEIRKA